MLCTWPVRKHQVVPMEPRVLFNDDGTLTHLKPEERHGNPVDPDGALVTVDYGYDIHHAIAEWADFDVRVYRFNDQHHGILGEYTEVFFARKRLDGFSEVTSCPTRKTRKSLFGKIRSMIRTL